VIRKSYISDIPTSHIHGYQAGKAADPFYGEIEEIPLEKGCINQAYFRSTYKEVRKCPRNNKKVLVKQRDK
jgi:hypothetical protein